MKFIFTILALFVAWLIFWQLPVNGWHYEISEGEHTGYITAVERNGIIWKTPRVYMKTKLDSSQEDAYCVVENEELLETLRQASIDEQRVTLEFVDWMVQGMSNCKGEIAVVTSIK